MTDIRNAFEASLMERLEKLHAEKGEISAEDAGAIVTSLLQSSKDNVLYTEIATMARDIQDAKREIMTLTTSKDANAQAISDASQHLDTVIKATEEATNTIMDAVDKIRDAAEAAGGQEGEKIQEACTHIFEACNFQDLSSQRIRKVMKLISTIEKHVCSLVMLFNIPVPEQPGAAKAASSEVELPADDNDLLNGPQLPEEAISQDDVDDLFKSLNTGN
jgi:chemotaxis protein CheZ